ncbi:2,4-dichlorophenol 6-monooxygenase [Penicillium brasilianum]|uniref:2,4-dichlorophenol 6-monooxygenase n=1 Tax=Penicillium brasilianum TaxID=104259 RepID=A0A1S9RTM0_PENBI|nr:2,4-dichlorophenol 6-monooxygenase [Penicillium brasilianum]
MGSYTGDTPVVIVGAGLAGLTTALALGTYGIQTVLIERRSESSQHPRADGFTARTVEIFRSFGIGPDILPETAPSFKTQRTRVMSLTGQWFEELAWNDQEKNEDTAIPKQPEWSPYQGSSTPQDQVEPILMQRVIDLGVDVRMGHELVGLAQNDKGVTVTIKNSKDGAVYFIKSSYLVAADGHRSAIRETLAIPRKGHGPVNSVQSVLFRAPELSPYLKKGFKQFTIDQPDLKAFMIAYQDERLVLHLPNDRVWNDELIQKAILQSIGPEKVTLEVLATSRWDMSAWIADEFSRGRVFLVGDAAHSLPPNRGGYGANTGIADGHNLAWKLAQVLQGVSDDRLLSSYQAERLPVAWLRHDQIFARSDYKTLQREASTSGSSALGQSALPDAAVEFGQIYRSSGVIGADESLPEALTPDLWKGQPGTRLPHCWIELGEESLSTLQLHSGDWVVLSEDPEWAGIVKQVQANLGVQAQFIHVQQSEDVSIRFSDAFGVSQRGCSLVRPDGHIAWKLAEVDGDPKAALEEAWKTVSCYKG